MERSGETPAARIVVTAVGDAVGGQLAESRFVDRPFLPGGEHNLYEFAFAAATIGYDVELRGWLDRAAFDRLTAAAGTQPRVGLPPRKPEADDVVVVPEGWREPLDYLRLLLSPATVAVYVLAAPGLFGWPFIAEAWEQPDPLTVPLDRLARPEHFQGMVAVGFQLLTHSPGIVDAARAAGVDCTFVGTGRAGWSPPAEIEKSVDVAALLDNRWAPLAERVLEELGGLTIDRIETVPNEEMLSRLARARTLVWPSRIEGHATIPWEARSAGCVPVAFDSNRFAVGLDEAHGAVLVGGVEQMAPALRALLAEEARWAALSRRGRDTAPEEVAWDPYVERVRRFLEAVRVRDPGRAPLAGLGRALDARLEHLAAEYQRRREELLAAGRDLTEATRNQERMAAEIEYWRKEVGPVRDEKERLERELRGLLSRRSVKAALRVSGTVRRKDG